MKKYRHQFVENYKGMGAFGWNRETDEDTVVLYLQMVSDDQLMQLLRKRLTDQELHEIYILINRLLKKHLNDAEYHRLFLKEDHPESG